MVKDISLTAEDALLIDDHLLFVSREINGICIFDIKKSTTNIVGELPGEEPLGYRLCSKIIKNDDSIIFVPMNAKKIWIYNLRYGDWESVEIEDAEIAMKFMQGFLTQKELVLIGCFYPAILRVELKTGRVTYYKEIHERFSNKSNSIPFFRRDFVNHEKSFLIASCRSNEVFEINTDTWVYNKYTVGEEYYRFSGITWDGRNYWLSLWGGGGVLKWDGNHWEAIEANLQKNVSTVSNTGICFEPQQRRVIVPGRDAEETIYVNIENDKVKKENKSRYLFYSINGGEIVYGLSTGKIGILKDDKKCEYTTRISRKYIMKKKLFGSPVLENDVIGLPDYLNYICKDVKS